VNSPVAAKADFLEENPLDSCGFGLHQSRKCYRPVRFELLRPGVLFREPGRVFGANRSSQSGLLSAELTPLEKGLNDINDTVIRIQQNDIAPLVKRRTRMRDIQTNHVSDADIVTLIDIHIGMLVHDLG
jgi:hypothetical protein